MLEIRDLRYEVDDGDRTLGILQGISLTIPEHKFIVVTGPNGGGKTTLAKAIMGIVEPTGGQILWNGQDVTHMSITDRARLGISYGFQQPPRFKGLRVRDLLALAAGSEKLPRGEGCLDPFGGVSTGASRPAPTSRTGPAPPAGAGGTSPPPPPEPPRGGPPGTGPGAPPAGPGGSPGQRRDA